MPYADAIAQQRATLLSIDRELVAIEIGVASGEAAQLVARARANVRAAEKTLIAAAGRERLAGAPRPIAGGDALCLETVPYRVAAHVRAEWLAAIEDGVVEVGISTALALADIPALAINLDDLAGLAAGPMAIRFIAAPTLGERS